MVKVSRGPRSTWETKKLGQMHQFHFWRLATLLNLEVYSSQLPPLYLWCCSSWKTRIQWVFPYFQYRESPSFKNFWSAPVTRIIKSEEAPAEKKKTFAFSFSQQKSRNFDSRTSLALDPRQISVLFFLFRYSPDSLNASFWLSAVLITWAVKVF